MRRRRRKLRPCVEPIESRALLSAGIGGASAVGAMVSHGPIRSIRLDGTLDGRYRVNVVAPDVGKTYAITGSGRVHGIGETSVTGAMHSLGFIARGHAQGDVTRGGARGTLSLHLTGVIQQSGFQGLPSEFRFSITGGTGIYRRVHENGTATLALTPDPAGAGGLSGGQGAFSLVLTPRPIPR
jgi:hypothetical protein